MASRLGVMRRLCRTHASTYAHARCMEDLLDSPPRLERREDQQGYPHFSCSVGGVQSMPSHTKTGSSRRRPRSKQPKSLVIPNFKVGLNGFTRPTVALSRAATRASREKPRRPVTLSLRHPAQACKGLPFPVLPVPTCIQTATVVLSMPRLVRLGSHFHGSRSSQAPKRRRSRLAKPTLGKLLFLSLEEP